jgi:hypothetical protein
LHETNQLENMASNTSDSDKLRTTMKKMNSLVKSINTHQTKTSSIMKSSNETPTFIDESKNMHEYFIDVTSITNPVSLDISALTFGSCSRFRITEYKTIHVRNHTDGKITCEALIPGYNTTTLENESGSFVVFPESVDIPARGTETFKIGFRPTRDNMMYSTQIEFACYFKSMRSFRLVNDKTFTPPWLLPLRVSG